MLVISLAPYYVRATSYTWNGATNHNWNTTTNWTPNGTPGSGDNVTLNSTGNSPTLQNNVTVTNFTISSGTFDCNGDTITINGTGNFNGGTVTNGLLYLRGTTTTFTAGTMDVPVDAIVTSLLFSGTTFNKKVIAESTSTTPGTGSGGSTFNDTVSVYRSSASSGNMTLANSSGNIYNKLVTLRNAGTGILQTTNGGRSKFNENIVLECSGTGGISLGTATGGDTLVSGKTFGVGANGFSAGTLVLRNFVQVGSTAQSFSLSAANMNLVSCTFNGAVTFSGLSILLKQNIFNSTASITHSGNTSASSDGGNTFNSAANFYNTGTSNSFRLGLTNNDVFNDNVTCTASSGGEVRLAYNDTTTVNKNVTFSGTVNSGYSGTGVLRFAGSNAQTFTVSAHNVYHILMDKTSGDLTMSGAMSILGSLNFIKGNIITTSSNLITMNHGSTTSGANGSSFVSGPIKKVGSAAIIFPTGKNSSYRPLEISAPSVSNDAFTAEYFDSNQSSGYSRDTSIHYLNSCQHWQLARNNGSATVTVKLSYDSTSCGIVDSATLRVANWNGTKWKDIGNGGITGNRYVGKIVNSTAVATYGYFTLANNLCFLTANAGTDKSLCSGDSATIGASPVASFGTGPIGYTWSPSTALSSTTVTNPKASPSSNTNYVVTLIDSGGCTKTDTLTVNYHSLPTASAGVDTTFCTGDSVAIGGSPTASGGSSPYTYSWNPSTGLSSSTTANPKANPGSTTNYIVTVTDVYGCTKKDTAVVTSHSIVYTWTGATSYYWNTSSNWSPSGIPGECDVVYLNSHVYLNNSVSVKSLISNGTDLNLQTFNLSVSGKTIFNSSTVTNGDITIYAEDSVSFNSSYFGATVNGGGQKIFFNGNTFTTYSEFFQTGNDDTYSNGGNVFNGGFSMENLGNGNIYFATAAVDTFKADVYIQNYENGNFYPAYTKNSVFKGDVILLGTNRKLVFGANGGRSIFSGSAEQAISGGGVDTLVNFTKLQINKSAGSLTLSSPIRVSDSLFLTKGNITSDTTHLLIINAGSVVTGATDTSFVNGPMRKIGNTLFTFSTGKNNHYRPIEISAPSNSTDAFTAEYFDSGIHVNEARDSSLEYISKNFYWTLSRNSGSSTVYPSLSWYKQNTVLDTSKIRVVKWNASQWQDFGKSSITGNFSSGKVKASSVSSATDILTIGAADLNVSSCSMPVQAKPDAYYNFDASGGQKGQNDNANPASPSSYLSSKSHSLEVASDTLVPVISDVYDYSFNNTSFHKKVKGINFSINGLNDYFAAEMLVKFDKTLSLTQQSLEFFRLGNTTEQPALKATLNMHDQQIEFYTSALRTNGTVYDTNLIIPLNGVERQSLPYYMDDKWHHFVFVYDAGEGIRQLWVDGELNTGFTDTLSVTGTINDKQNNDLEFILNAPADSSFWDELMTGYYDEISLYATQKLCPEQIVNHYQATAGSTDSSANYSYIDITDSLSITPPRSLGGYYLFDIITRYEYDHAGRVINVFEQVGSYDDEKLIAHYTYNPAGQVIQKSVGLNNTTAEYMQNIDLRYNERGWLQKINNSSLEPDGDNLDNNDVFGEELLYNEVATLNTNESEFVPQEQFNGNVAAMKWKSKIPSMDGADETEHSYSYRYDNINRMTAAYYAENSLSNPTTFDANMHEFDEQLRYSTSGNIINLKRKGEAGWIDDLDYSYINGGYKLENVEDQAANSIDNDFHDISNTNDYIYDDNGNMTEDNNKGISLTYNHLNLVDQIDNGTSEVDYTYDATGRKLSKTSNGVTHYYANGIEYDNDKFLFITTQEGRVRPTNLLDGNTTQYVWDYFIKDHLGNVRVILTDEHKRVLNTASMEERFSTTEESQFYNISTTRTPRPWKMPTDSIINPNSKTSLVNESQPLGFAKVLPLMKGDTVSLRTQYYFDSEFKADVNNGFDDILGELLDVLSSGAISNPQTAEYESILDNVKSDVNLTDFLTALTADSGEETNIPKAYLTWLFFNKKLEFVPSMSGVLHANQPDDLQNLAVVNLEATESGYLYVYVSNESDKDVYFDNLQVLHTKGAVMEMNEYYPYGMMNQSLSESSPYLSPQNFYKYQDKELMPDINLQDFGLRNYDPTLARWNVADPMMQFFNPFFAMAGNPVSIIDPNGGFTEGYSVTHKDPSPFSIDPGDGGGQVNASYDWLSWVSLGRSGKKGDWMSGESASLPSNGTDNILSDESVENGCPIEIMYDGVVHVFTLPAVDVVDHKISNLEDVQDFAYDNFNVYSYMVSQPSTMESLTPMWGNGKSAFANFQRGRPLKGLMYTALAATDIFLLKSVFTGIVKGGISLSLKYAGREAVEEASFKVADIAFEGGLAEARALGVAGEEAVGVGSKVRIESLTGTANYRIPDILTQTTLEEVKNVGHQSLTRQLMDFHLYSQKNGLDFILHTRPTTTFSGPLQNLINNGSIIIKTIP